MNNKIRSTISSGWIPDEFISELKSKVKLSDVVRRDEPKLKREGHRWVSGHESGGHSSEGQRCLSVDDQKGLWHCFHEGLGGDVIDWVSRHRNMEFMQVIEWLCGEYNHSMPNWTAEQKQAMESRQQEQARIGWLMAEAFKYYRDQLQAEHRQYLNQRGITDQTIDDLLIGYAPPGGRALYDYLKDKPQQERLATGLFNQTKAGIFDHYQNRLVFPYQVNNEVVFSIGRLPTEHKTEIEQRHQSDRAKYKKHLIHSDSRPYVSQWAVQHTLYGLNSIKGNSDIILTEGPIDAILAIQAGLACIAPTTTRLKSDDIQQIERLTGNEETIYIANDVEPNRAGLEGAIATAEALFQAGRDVRIVELPKPEELDKIDLAVYLQFHSPSDLKNLLAQAKDYVDFQLQQIQELPSRKQDQLLRQLIKVVAEAKLDALAQARVKKQIVESKLINRSTLSKQIELSEDGQEGGQVTEYTSSVIEGEFCYSRSGEGEQVISSFILRPKVRIWIDQQEQLKVDFVTTDRIYPDVLIERRDWNSNDRFMDTFPSVDLHWKGQLNDVQDVLSIVSGYQMESKQGTNKLGYHPSGIWMLDDGQAYDQQGRVENPATVYLPQGGRSALDGKIQITDLEEGQFKPLLADIFNNLFHLNRAEVMFPVTGWFMATPFKYLFANKAGWESFPLLSVVGTRGSGKSTLLRLMWQLVGGFKSGEQGKLFSCTETAFVMMRLLSSSTTIPIIFDEYKPYDMPKQRKDLLHRALRKAYDGEREFRGRPDQTTVEYDLSAPVVVAGEQSLDEGALMERIIAVEMSPNNLDQEMMKAYQQMSNLNLSAFMGKYIPFCLSADFESELIAAEALLADFIPHPLPIRVEKNLVAMVLGLTLFLKFVERYDQEVNDTWFESGLSQSIAQVSEAVIEADGVTRVALDHLIQELATMAETGRLQVGVHYKIREIEGDLAIRLGASLSEYRRYHRETQLDTELLNDKAYRQQIKENHDREGYVTHTSMSVNLSGRVGEREQRRCVVICFDRAKGFGLDLDGFNFEVGF